MIWSAIIMMLAFYAFAVYTIGGMVTSGISVGLAMTAAALEVIVGILIARVMCSVRSGPRHRFH